MPVIPRLKQLYLSEEIAKRMRWHKERKHDSEDPDVMSHLADGEAWQALDRFDLEFARVPGVSVLACHWMVSNLTASIVVHILAGQFSSCITICRPTNV
jgi:hypothetical protein